MGVAAGNYIVEQLKAKGVSNPIIGEIPGIDSLELTQERIEGLRRHARRRTGSRSPTGGRPSSPPTPASRPRTALLQALPKIDAIWNHDDDQGIGVLAAIKQANRKEFFMVGGAGSKAAMERIKADNSVLKATVTYSPSMASSAISLARLIGQGKGMRDLVGAAGAQGDHARLRDDHQGERGRATCKLGF